MPSSTHTAIGGRRRTGHTATAIGESVGRPPSRATAIARPNPFTTTTVHLIDGEHVISHSGQWLPGAYPTRAAALRAAADWLDEQGA